MKMKLQQIFVNLHLTVSQSQLLPKFLQLFDFE